MHWLASFRFINDFSHPKQLVDMNIFCVRTTADCRSYCIYGPRVVAHGWYNIFFFFFSGCYRFAPELVYISTKMCKQLSAITSKHKKPNGQKKCSHQFDRIVVTNLTTFRKKTKNIQHCGCGWKLAISFRVVQTNFSHGIFFLFYWFITIYSF